MSNIPLFVLSKKKKNIHLFVLQVLQQNTFLCPCDCGDLELQLASVLAPEVLKATSSI